MGAPLETVFQRTVVTRKSVEKTEEARTVGKECAGQKRGAAKHPKWPRGKRLDKLGDRPKRYTAGLGNKQSDLGKSGRG